MWTSFAALSGGASAGLTGLIFIVVSIRFDPIALSQEYRNRAAQTLSLFLTVTVLAVLLTMPQPGRVFGIELIGVAAIDAALLSVLDGAARSTRRSRPTAALVTATFSFVGLIAAGGLFVLLGADQGLYLYAAGTVLALVWGVVGTWMFLTRAGKDPATAQEPADPR